jgi:hypothetical protein
MELKNDDFVGGAKFFGLSENKSRASFVCLLGLNAIKESFAKKLYAVVYGSLGFTHTSAVLF